MYVALKKKVDPVQHTCMVPLTFVLRIPKLFVVLPLAAEHRSSGVDSLTCTGTELIGLPVELFLTMRKSGSEFNLMHVVVNMVMVVDEVEDEGVWVPVVVVDATLEVVPGGGFDELVCDLGEPSAISPTSTTAIAIMAMTALPIAVLRCCMPSRLTRTRLVIYLCRNGDGHRRLNSVIRGKGLGINSDE